MNLHFKTNKMYGYFMGFRLMIQKLKHSWFISLSCQRLFLLLKRRKRNLYTDLLDTVQNIGRIDELKMGLKPAITSLNFDTCRNVKQPLATYEPADFSTDKSLSSRYHHGGHWKQCDVGMTLTFAQAP